MRSDQNLTRNFGKHLSIGCSVNGALDLELLKTGMDIKHVKDCPTARDNWK